MKINKAFSIFNAALFFSSALWAAEPRLISIKVLQDVGQSIKTTGEYSEAIESELADVVSTLDTNMKFYEDTGCAGNESADGCVQAREQIKENYSRMLDVVKNKLPEMRKSIKQASTSVARELANNVASKSVEDLQQHLLNQTSGKSPVEESKVRYSSKRMNGVRLSSRFKDYYELISSSRAQSSEPISVTASAILLDMQDSMNYIDFTMAAIEEQQVGLDFSASLGDVTPEMKNIVGGVQAVLFGQAVDVDQLAPHNIEFEEKTSQTKSWEADLGIKN
ncbi:MAG: hypothetical protein KDD40_00920 [Bdellovibrionales bacterium]|nr:hypothetical protein [Bdellovibrionales bacterium]